MSLLILVISVVVSVANGESSAWITGQEDVLDDFVFYQPEQTHLSVSCEDFFAD